MKYTTLGRTGLRVSRLCLGTVNFGPYTSEQESHSIMDVAIDSGINFLDTADVYGHVPGEGLTETILGNWFALGGGRRERVILATKVFNPMNREGEADPNQERLLNARKIIRNCEASLRRLKTDTIDLYQMHHVDRSCPWEEIWQAMELLVQQGKIIYVGSSNFAGWDIATACQTAARRGFLGLVSEQSVYNLARRAVELEVIPACRHYGLGLIPWSPLDRGLLAGTSLQGKGGRRDGDAQEKKRQSHHDQLDAYVALCGELGHSPARIALAWLLHNPVLTAPIIGPRSIDQLNDVLDVPEIALEEEILKRLDEIWPGPGGEAPEAYAW